MISPASWQKNPSGCSRARTKRHNENVKNCFFDVSTVDTFICIQWEAVTLKLQTDTSVFFISIDRYEGDFISTIRTHTQTLTLGQNVPKTEKRRSEINLH